MALDGIVNVKSHFTLGLFLGLAVNPTDPTYTLVDSSDTACLVPSFTAENLVVFHVYTFSSFLFSSLIAFGLKQAVRTPRFGDTRVEVNDGTIAHVNLRVLRAEILSSAFGSASGCLFLTLALVDLIQIKLGKLDCWNWYGVAAVGPLVVLVPLALVIYICIILHAFTR
ncbi:uncharacterized protein LOC112512254 [Cynara cardunculus var. scolymus]|uniref:Maternal effect embryo arrest 60 n=1 Tax=Cynara cardunculus var. scolymus TaxID=59895 RepID=A0A124SFL6_CYNCS|nr:uncharacterized protein LOC112512254 [Cynara cardunculus var. scolymus]KVI03628.1 hypothetical protein Ccrd_018058 [Cynara cardunculus var. scolymus]